MTSEQSLKSYAGRKLNWLIQIQSDGERKAVFARLRQGVGKVPGEDPMLWGTFLGDMPEEMYGQNGNPSREEWAAYTVLTLFALHQQGKDISDNCMHQEDRHLGSSLAELVKGEEDRDRIIRRFNMVAASADMQEMAYHLRGVVQLLRRDAIPVDYVDLAGDLFRFQFPEQRDSVRLKWGQDFYSVINRQNWKGADEENE